MGKVGGIKAKGAGAGAAKAKVRDTSDPATITIYSDGTSSHTPGGGKGLKRRGRGPIK